MVNLPRKWFRIAWFRTWRRHSCLPRPDSSGRLAFHPPLRGAHAQLIVHKLTMHRCQWSACSRPALRLAISQLFVATVLMTSCSSDPYIAYRSTSPDGHSALEVSTFVEFTPLYSRNVVALTLRTNNRVRVLRKWTGSSIAVCFASATWSKNSQSVSAVVRNCYLDPGELISYDDQNNRFIKSQSLESELAEKIRRDYNLPPQ